MMLSSSTADRVCGDRLATAPNLIAVGLLESDHQRTNGAVRRPSWTGPPPSSRPGRLCIRFAVTRQAAGWRRTRGASYGSTSHKPWSTITSSRCLARSPPGPDRQGRDEPVPPRLGVAALRPELLARRELGTTSRQPKTRHAVSATENAQSHWPLTAATAWATAL